MRKREKKKKAPSPELAAGFIPARKGLEVQYYKRGLAAEEQTYRGMRDVFSTDPKSIHATRSLRPATRNP